MTGKKMIVVEGRVLNMTAYLSVAKYLGISKIDFPDYGQSQGYRLSLSKILKHFPDKTKIRITFEEL
jgi:hypothetical protein